MNLPTLAGVSLEDNEKFSKVIAGSRVCLHLLPFPELIRVTLSNL